MLLTTTLGEKIVSKGSAETLGSVDGVVVDAANHKITALRVGKGRKAKVVPWDEVTGVGTAAVIVERDDALRDPDEGTEARDAGGDIAVIGASCCPTSAIRAARSSMSNTKVTPA